MYNSLCFQVHLSLFLRSEKKINSIIFQTVGILHESVKVSLKKSLLIVQLTLWFS